MRFGLFGGPYRAGSGPSGYRKGYSQFIDMVTEAESLGFSSVFVVEHHFTGLGQVSASLNLLTSLAARTSTMRLGTAVAVLPWHNPVLLAEQTATVDVLSGGRLDLGIGRGYRPVEFHGFGIDPAEAQERYEECLEVLIKSWTSSERFSHQGTYWNFRDVVVEPQPIQEPHPCIWTGAGSERSIRGAARSGFRLLLDQYGSAEQVRQRIEWYRSEVTTMGRTFDAADVALARPLLLVEPKDLDTLDAEYDRRVAAIRRLREASRIPGDDTPLTAEDHDFFNDARVATVDAAIAGTPDDCIQRLLELKNAGVETVLFNDPSGSIERLRYFSKEVMPALA
ncbi:MAG: LLM class flavin-dependent oxidoreductase [Streptosporangiales bacterium]|nr:LLM class flavin-dependent oxidoreductase [Streptosporangiales bacterium]